MTKVGKIKIDFQILPVVNPKKLFVMDDSEWNSAEDLQATIFITPPGATNPIVNNFYKHQITTFNSVNLGLNCLTECSDEQDYQDLSDGIWKICLKSGYTGFESKRYHLKTDSFRIDLDKAYISAGFDYSESKKKVFEDLMYVEILLKTAAAYTREGNITKANRDFNEAVKLYNAYNKCK
jgi:hypothetical protein